MLAYQCLNQNNRGWGHETSYCTQYGIHRCTFRLSQGSNVFDFSTPKTLDMGAARAIKSCINFDHSFYIPLIFQSTTNHPIQMERT